MGKYIDPYLEEGEELVDLLMETIIPSFDFRWILLTNKRVVRIVYKWFEYSFYDVLFDGIDLHFTAGIFYDTLQMKSMTDDYSAHFYAFGRDRTKAFMQQIEEERSRFQFDKMKEQVKTDHRVKETLIIEGELSPKEDPGHAERLKKERRLKKEVQKEPEIETIETNSYDAIKAIGEIDNLKYRGILTPEEYEQKRREILDRMT